MTDSEKILAASLNSGFELWVDSQEWASMDLSTRTARILNAWADWADSRQTAKNETEQERITGHLQDARLKDLVWRAWRALPRWERAVLRALDIQFIETNLPDGTIARCSTGTDIEAGVPPRPTIKFSPSKYYNHADDEVLLNIFHELVHASYRTVDIQNTFPHQVRKKMEDHFEQFCEMMGYRLLQLEQRENSHNDDGAAEGPDAQG